MFDVTTLSNEYQPISRVHLVIDIGPHQMILKIEYSVVGNTLNLYIYCIHHNQCSSFTIDISIFM